MGVYVGGTIMKSAHSHCSPGVSQYKQSQVSQMLTFYHMIILNIILTTVFSCIVYPPHLEFVSGFLSLN